MVKDSLIKLYIQSRQQLKAKEEDDISDDFNSSNEPKVALPVAVLKKS
jgi:hypothetical protein